MICLLLLIKLTTTDENLPLILEHTQFPVSLCFAMTIQKSQEQSIDHVCVDLRTHAFTHGQVYVPLSRVTSQDGLRLLTSKQLPNHTNIILYQEVLL